MRIPINIELIATVGLVAVIGIVVVIIGFSADFPHYLAYPILAVMAAPVVVYFLGGRVKFLRRGAPDTAAPEPAEAEAGTEEGMEAPAHEEVPPPAPVEAPAPAPAPEAPSAAGQISEKLGAIESQLSQILQVSNSILANTAKLPPMQAAPPIATPTGEPALPKKRSVLIKVKQSDIKPDVNPQDEVEDLRANGAMKPGRRQKNDELIDENIDSIEEQQGEGAMPREPEAAPNGNGSGGASSRRPKSDAPLTRLEELNILREELVKLRSKLDVPEPKQK